MKKTTLGRLLGSAGVGVILLMLIPQAGAIPINGEISFAGGYTVDNSNLSLATAFNSFSNVSVIGGIGDYSGTAGTTVTMNGFTFRPSLSPSPVSPLWTFTIGGTTYSFDLKAVSIDFNTPSVLVLSGSGTAKITGKDDTPGDWNLTANTFGTTFSFSSSVAVPDGGLTLILLGGGMLGLAVLRRKA